MSFEKAFADPISQLYRGAEAQAMGDAVTAIIDDDTAVFYNPAGLAGAQDFHLKVLSLNVEASDNLISSSSIVLPFLSGGFSTAAINSLIGKKVYEDVQAISTVSAFGFGAAAIGDVQSAIRLINPNNPTGTLGAQATYGAQVGYGKTVYHFKKKRGEIRVGVSGKYLLRTGGFHDPTITDILTLNTSNIVGNITNFRSFGYGLGWDVGMQMIYRLDKRFSLLAGLAATDIGNTSFSNGSTAQLSNLASGIGIRYKSHDLVATFAYDFKHVFESIDWQKKVHFGLELKFPIISLYGGFSELYPSFGVGVDLFFVKLMYVSYTEELASVVGINPEHRNLVNAQFNFNL